MAIRKSSISGTPSGNTASRPANPEIGATYNNGTLGVEEIYTASGWVAKSAPASIPVNVVATNQGSGRAFNNGQASVAFSNGEGGGLVDTFIVTPSPATSPTTFTGSSSPVTVTGLQSSQQYTYTIQARNNFGTSLSSAASAGVTATTVPQAPTIGTATASTDGSATASVTFTANATGGSAITGFTVTSSPGNITASGASSPITVTGLTNNTTYTFTVTATNTNGTSAASSASNSITPTDSISVQYLVIAGGGGGGNDGGGGGGAGGYRSSVSGENSGRNSSAESALAFLSGSSYTITVGAGGTGGLNAGDNGTPGANSSISGTGITTVTSQGGGYGGGNAKNGGNGGAGGGAGQVSYFTAGGTGTVGQGFNGGDQENDNGGGGGGGASAAGNTAQGTAVAGAGGGGISSSITGSSVFRAGGGGGGAWPSGSGGGGDSGGGAGGSMSGGSRLGANGSANYGGGGGGGTGGGDFDGGNGGSGIVILRYPSSRTISVGAGLTSSTSTVGGNKVTTFTAGTGTISFS